jgi:hypothetical protein
MALSVRRWVSGTLLRPWALRAILAGVTLAGASMVFGACGSLAATSAGSSTTSPRSSTARSEPPPAKAPLTGLLDMGVQSAYHRDVPFPTVDLSAITPYASAFGGIVVNENWLQLEPSPGKEVWTDLDSSLAAVRQWNAAHPATPLGVKFRIFGGYAAPSWAKTLGGPPITIVTKGVPRTYGRWWTTSYAAAWSSFQHALAARYDSDPLVRAVSVGSCATLTGEPFVINLSPPAVQVMESAGWTPQAQQRCLDGALADYSGWLHTPVTFAFNPYRTITNGHAVLDQSVTDEVMAACADSRHDGGPDCVLGNNALSDVSTTGGPAAIYAQIDSLWQSTPGHVSVYFQTVGAGVDCTAVNIAIAHHATAVELWPPNLGYQGFAAIPMTDLEAWNNALRTGQSLVCTG